MPRVSIMLPCCARLVSLYRRTPKKVWRCATLYLSDDSKARSTLKQPKRVTMGIKPTKMMPSNKRDQDSNKSKPLSRGRFTTSNDNDEDYLRIEPEILSPHYDDETTEINEDNKSEQKQEVNNLSSKVAKPASLKNLLLNTAKDTPGKSFTKEEMNELEMEAKRGAELFQVVYPIVEMSKGPNKSNDPNKGVKEEVKAHSYSVGPAYADYAFGYDGLWDTFPSAEKYKNHPSPKLDNEFSAEPYVKNDSMTIKSLYEKLLENEQKKRNIRAAFREKLILEEFLQHCLEDNTPKKDIPSYKPFQTTGGVSREIQSATTNEPFELPSAKDLKEFLQSSNFNEQDSYVIMRYALIKALQKLKTGSNTINAKVTIRDPRTDQ